LIHCLKTNLHCHTDHLSYPPGKWHASSYPARGVVDLFTRNGFDALGITEHVPQDSGPALAVAARHVQETGGSLLLIPGRELDIAGCHVLELLDENRAALRILNHPVRTRGLAELAATARRYAAEYGIEAVEFDMLAAEDPAIARAYDEIFPALPLPVVSNSDFHGMLFTAANHFTVYLCAERSVAAILRALRAGDFVAFYPDKASWRMCRRSGGSPLAEAWLRGAPDNVFSRAPDDFMRLTPPVRFPAVTPRDIEEFHHTRGLTLRHGEIVLHLLPERGARMAGLWLSGRQVVDPILNAAVDSEAVAEVFEAATEPFEVVEAGENHATFERLLRDRPDFAGVVYRKSIRIQDGSVLVSSERRNTSAREVLLNDALRFRFLKDYAAHVSCDLRAPACERLDAPINARLEFPAEPRRCDLTFHAPGYAVNLCCEDERLEALRLAARPADGFAQAVLTFKPQTLPPGGASPAYRVTLTPRLR